MCKAIIVKEIISLARFIFQQYKKTVHTVDKCYKLHGFPLGYRFNHNSNQNTLHVNFVSNNSQIDNQNRDEVVDVITSLTNSPCQQLTVVLTGKLASANCVTVANEKESGIHYNLTLSFRHYQSNICILDTGET
uniref:Uncharacterized protein n=1 Tax=Lactuca sativa TaxID=4236 RepID=A0A9R1WY16_LACSA|nr:hypothetical protein LSAT_V11C800411810 [Lactuca sativa]